MPVRVYPAQTIFGSVIEYDEVDGITVDGFTVEANGLLDVGGEFADLAGVETTASDA